MKVLNRWLTKADWLRPVITVLWMPDEVSLVLWEADAERVRYPRTAYQIQAPECTASLFQKIFRQLLDETTGKKYRVKWIFPVELFPATFTNGSRMEASVPLLSDWIRQCWTELPEKVIPENILCGLSAVEADLHEWDSFCRTGNGFLFPLGERFVFYGYSGESTHRRVSRKALDPEGHCGVSHDWIQQTRMLYRNRTGTELARILTPEHLPCTKVEETAPGEKITIQSGVEPPFWLGGNMTLQEPGVVYLHSCALKTEEHSSRSVSLEFIEKKRRRERWGKSFRTASTLLIIGWIASLVAACRTVDDQSDVCRPDQLEWEAQQRLWYSKNDEWIQRAELNHARTMPFHVVGRIAQSVPGEMRLDRLQLDDTHDELKESYKLEIEGCCRGREPASDFRKWMDYVKRESLVSQVEDMRFERNGDVLEFTLHAILNKEEI